MINEDVLKIVLNNKSFGQRRVGGRGSSLPAGLVRRNTSRKEDGRPSERQMVLQRLRCNQTRNFNMNHMKAITTSIVFTVSLIGVCLTADGLTRGNIPCTVACIAFLIVFALNGSYIEKHWERLEREIDEMFPED